MVRNAHQPWILGDFVLDTHHHNKKDRFNIRDSVASSVSTAFSATILKSLKFPKEFGSWSIFTSSHPSVSIPLCATRT